jgi:hypothetical protein
VKIKGKGGVIYKKKVKDGDVFEISQGAAGFKGGFLAVQIGAGKFKTKMKIGTDCKKGRDVKIGDQWGVLTIVGYELKKGENCAARSVDSDTEMLFGQESASSRGGSNGAKNNHMAVKITAAFAGIILIAATVVAVRTMLYVQGNPNDTIISDFIEGSQVTSSVSSINSASPPHVKRAGTRFTLTGNARAHAPDDKIIGVGPERRIDGV